MLSSQPPLTLESIESAIDQIDGKKESLKRAFEELQSQTSLIPSLSLSWSDLDAHFTVVQRSLSHQFRLLQSLENSRQLESSSPSSGSGSVSSTRVDPNEDDPSKSDPEHEDPSGSKADFDGKKSVLSRVDPVDSEADPENGYSIGENSGLGRVDRGGDLCRVELRGFCERLDGDGLMKYIDKHWDECDRVRVELVDAMECASDPALLVLEAVERFAFFSKGKRRWRHVMRGCHMLLDTLVEMKSVKVSGEVMERAKRLVSDWKKKDQTRKKFHVMGLLRLLGAFRLRSELSLEDFVDHLIVAKPQQASKLCELLGFNDKILDVIQKLLSERVQLLALELILNFDLTDKFPPVPLLNSYIEDSKKRAKKVYEDANNARWAERAAISIELNVLKAVVKFIGDHNLESEYPRADLEKVIEQLEKRKVDSKRPARGPTSKPRQQNEQHQLPPESGNKRPRIIPPVEAREILPLGQSHLGLAGLLSDDHSSYLSFPAVPYILAGSAPGVVPLTGTSEGIYGSAATSAGIHGSSRNPADINGNQIPSSFQLHSSETYIPSGYNDRLTAYGVLGAPPQYHLPKYDQ